MKELELLQQKLEQLLKRYAALQANVSRLEKTNARQAVVIEEQQTKIETLQKELQLKSVALSATYTGSDKDQLKQHLDKVIIEIEKNLELL
jgi:cysteine sulfinate desulfinase/cysteine desulfurase-like protein